jgi:hypothetical protein
VDDRPKEAFRSPREDKGVGTGSNRVTVPHLLGGIDEITPSQHLRAAAHMHELSGKTVDPGLKKERLELAEAGSWPARRASRSR